MPNKPMTATRKSKPRISSFEPKVRRRLPDTELRPTLARAKPSIIEAMVLKGDALLMPTKLQKARR